MREIGRQLVYLAIAVLALVIVLALFGMFGSLQSELFGAAGAATPSGSTPPPPPSPAVIQQLQQSPGANYVVSYTNMGFQPSVLTVREGQTVRFVNNSSKQVWIASVGTNHNDIYPGSSACGSSAFDSCEALHPGDFWEFTFNQPGIWDFENNLDKSQLGSVTVSAM